MGLAGIVVRALTAGTVTVAVGAGKLLVAEKASSYDKSSGRLEARSQSNMPEFELKG